jgi:hypothetical protein
MKLWTLLLLVGVWNSVYFTPSVMKSGWFWLFIISTHFLMRYLISSLGSRWSDSDDSSVPIALGLVDMFSPDVHKLWLSWINYFKRTLNAKIWSVECEALVSHSLDNSWFTTNFQKFHFLTIFMFEETKPYTWIHVRLISWSTVIDFGVPDCWIILDGSMSPKNILIGTF